LTYQWVHYKKTCEGLPRVTSTKRVLESVIPKLVSYFESIQINKSLNKICAYKSKLVNMYVDTISE